MITRQTEGGARIACEFGACTTTAELAEANGAERIIEARKLGWLVQYEGAGHGWVHFCPHHGTGWAGRAGA